MYIHLDVWYCGKPYKLELGPVRVNVLLISYHGTNWLHWMLTPPEQCNLLASSLRLYALSVYSYQSSS